ncbi:MAG: hypothetical protein K0U24_04645 [Gammaproteobacteria bacterium]|nr:hypothetical protein [Gammaproteobacteria bacterium]MCH9716422.1 hypothetical protein [Gammaproteobacteria bacterium]MCH9763504.1 hypothetical protein [Gammaproteobacteria bacterium]
MSTLDKDDSSFMHQPENAQVDETISLKNIYSPPMLIRLDSDNIAGGIPDLQEGTGTAVGWFS